MIFREFTIDKSQFEIHLVHNSNRAKEYTTKNNFTFKHPEQKNFKSFSQNFKMALNSISCKNVGA